MIKCLSGYETQYGFGAYIDWKEESEDVMWHLEKGVLLKKYELDLNDITYL